MNELIAVETNCETGETIHRPFTAEEIAIHEANVAAWEIEQAKMQVEAAARAALKDSARAKLVMGQPLTEEEAATIVL